MQEIKARRMEDRHWNIKEGILVGCGVSQAMKSTYMNMYLVYNWYWLEANCYTFQFSCSVMFSSLRLHGLQHARHPCPSLTAGACSKSCLLSHRCHPIISSSVVPFSSHLQSFPASGSFPMCKFFASGSQHIGASASVFPMNIQDLFPLGWTGWISLQSKGLSRVFSNTTVQSINSLALSFLYGPTLTSIHDHWKNHSFDYDGPLLAK